MQELVNRRIVLGLSGGIACYKSAELCRLLVRAGAQVQVILTAGAQRFVTATTLQALSQRPVFDDTWDMRDARAMPHITLGREADLLLIAPCSADTLARLASGRCDDLLSLTCLARPAATPLLVAPAMNREMWGHPATQRNVATLRADGVQVLPVGVGEQACGEVGDGRMREPTELLDDVATALTPALLKGRRVLITAGPTFEALDPVRGLTNRSSGKMGYALGRAARHAGAIVTLVTGPTALAVPVGVQGVPVESACDMHAAVLTRVAQTDVFIAAAAVADWRVRDVASQKIKKTGERAVPTLDLVENPDILAEVAASARARSGALYCVGFAAESDDLIEHAQAKRLRKGVPLLVANLGPATFGRDDNTITLIDADGVTPWPPADKQSLAAHLIAHIADRLPPLGA